MFGMGQGLHSNPTRLTPSHSTQTSWYSLINIIAPTWSLWGYEVPTDQPLDKSELMEVKTPGVPIQAHAVSLGLSLPWP